MTDETQSDDVDRQADSGRGTNQKRNAEVVRKSPPDDPDVYLVRYPDGSVEYEPATVENRLLFEDGLYDQINGNNAFTLPDGSVVETRINLDDDMYRLFVGNTPVRVPSEYKERLIGAFTRTDTAGALLDLYNDLTDGQVRRNAVEQFLDLFPSDRVDVTGDGWVVDDTFLVDWEANNYLVNDVAVWSVSGSEAVEVDESKQAVYLGLNAQGERSERTPNGDSVTLSEEEQEFLTTVECLLFPEDYFGVDLVDEVEQKRVEGSVKNLFTDLAEESEVNGFTDSKTGQYHGSSNHSFGKHKLEYEGVTQDVEDLLWSHGYDHAGVHEMLYRYNELVGRDDIDVFEDAPDDDTAKWDRLKNIASGATISPETRAKLQDMFGSQDY